MHIDSTFPSTNTRPKQSHQNQLEIIPFQGKYMDMELYLPILTVFW